MEHEGTKILESTKGSSTVFRVFLDFVLSCSHLADPDRDFMS